MDFFSFYSDIIFTEICIYSDDIPIDLFYLSHDNGMIRDDNTVVLCLSQVYGQEECDKGG